MSETYDNAASQKVHNQPLRPFWIIILKGGRTRKIHTFWRELSKGYHVHVWSNL